MEKPNLPVAVDPAQFNVSAEMAQDLTKGLEQIKSEKAELIKEYDRILKLDINDPETWAAARQVRLKIRDNRTKGIAVWHKNKKEIFLRGGQFIDAIKRDEADENQRMEANLEEIEKHEEILRKKELDQRMEKRMPLIEPYKEFIPVGVNIREILDDDFEKLLNGARLQYEAEQERLRKEEEERLENERLDQVERERLIKVSPFALFVTESPDLRNISDEDFERYFNLLQKAKSDYDAEQEKIRAENERLRKEAEEKEKNLKILRNREQLLIHNKFSFDGDCYYVGEFKRLDRGTILSLTENAFNDIVKAGRKEADRIEAERQAELKAEREKQAKLEAEAKERQAELERKQKEAEKLAKAPVKKQLTAWVEQFALPETNATHELRTEIEQKFEAYKNWAKTQINNL